MPAHQQTGAPALTSESRKPLQRGLLARRLQGQTVHHQAPRAMALPDLHERLLPVIQRHVPSGPDVRVLDFGAGQGALTQRLVDAGYSVSACDMFPELFRCAQVQCRKADAHEPLPYRDDSFDAVVAAEVVEHLETQFGLFREVYRVLKPRGKFIFTTPNIASLKSRLNYLFTGYLYSHGPLDPAVDDPVSQHIAPFTPDRYRFLLGRAGLDMVGLETDKYQKTSVWLCWMSPWIQLWTRIKYDTTPGTMMQNCPVALFGRTMIGVACKWSC